MALNEDWENLAENAEEFERKATWARAGKDENFFTIVPSLLAAAVPLSFVYLMCKSFANDQWTIAFLYVFLAAFSTYFYYRIKTVMTFGVIILFVGLVLYLVGSCAAEKIGAKVQRELGNNTTVVDTPETVQVAAPTEVVPNIATTVDDPIPSKAPALEEDLAAADTFEDFGLPSNTETEEGYKLVPCEGMMGEKANCLVKEDHTDTEDTDEIPLPEPFPNRAPNSQDSPSWYDNEVRSNSL